MKKIAIFLISVMLLVNPFVCAFAEGEVTVTNEEGDVVLEYESGEEVVIISSDDEYCTVPENGMYTVDGADISVVDQNGLSVMNLSDSDDRLAVESNVNIETKAEVYPEEGGPATIDGIYASGEVAVLENGNVSSDGTAVHAEDGAYVYVNGTATATETGISAEDGAAVIVNTNEGDITEILDTAETIDELKGLETGKTAVSADQTGIYVEGGAGGAAIGNVEVITTESSFGTGVLVEPNPYMESSDKGASLEESSSTEDTLNSVMVAGDVKVEVNPVDYQGWSYAEGVAVYPSENDAQVLVTGDVTASAKDGETRGINANAEEADTTIVVGGKVTAEGIDTIGVYETSGDEWEGKKGTVDVTVGGVEATGTIAQGVMISAYNGGTSTLTVEGDVEVTAKENTKSSSSSKPDYETVRKNNYWWYDVNNNGIQANLYDGTIDVEVTGNVSVDADYSSAGVAVFAGHFSTDAKRTIILEDGKELTGWDYSIDSDGTVKYRNSDTDYEIVGKAKKVIYDEENDEGAIKGVGETTITVGGNVEGDVIVAHATDDTTAKTTITVGDVTADLNGEVEGAVLINQHVTEDADLTITVWKIDTVEDDHAVFTYGENKELTSTEATEAIEKKINYIIKVEPNANGTINTNGQETAYQGDTVVVSVAPNAGYHVTAAYDDYGKTVPMIRQADGTYSFVVPCGGGIYLSAIFDADDNGDSWERSPVVVKAEVVGATDSKISAEDAKTLSYYSPEQQVAIILTKLGMDDALKASGIRMKDLAKKAADGITSDFSELVTEEELTIDGETAVWKVITVMENGKLVKYCFRQLADGTWVFKKI